MNILSWIGSFRLTNLKLLAFDFRLLTSYIPHPTSHIPHPTSHILHPTSHITQYPQPSKTLNPMITQIIWLLTWPVLIAVSFFAISWMLKKFEKNTGS